MNKTDCAIIRAMRNAEGTNWTPLSIAEQMDTSRAYVKSRMNVLAEWGALEKVSRGLYRAPRN